MQDACTQRPHSAHSIDAFLQLVVRSHSEHGYCTFRGITISHFKHKNRTRKNVIRERESSHRTMRVTETDVPWLLCTFDAGHVMPSARSTVIETTGQCRLIVAVGFTSWMLNGRQVRRIETFDKADGHRTPVGSFCLLPWVGLHQSSRAARPFPRPGPPPHGRRSSM